MLFLGLPCKRSEAGFVEEDSLAAWWIRLSDCSFVGRDLWRLSTAWSSECCITVENRTTFPLLHQGHSWEDENPNEWCWSAKRWLADQAKTVSCKHGIQYSARSHVYAIDYAIFCTNGQSDVIMTPFQTSESGTEHALYGSNAPHTLSESRQADLSHCGRKILEDCIMTARQQRCKLFSNGIGSNTCSNASKCLIYEICRIKETGISTTTVLHDLIQSPTDQQIINISIQLSNNTASMSTEKTIVLITGGKCHPDETTNTSSTLH